MTKRSPPKTDWYAGYQKPTYTGAYQRNYKGYHHYCWWDGTMFGPSAPTPLAAKNRYTQFGAVPKQTLPWRGLAQEATA